VRATWCCLTGWLLSLCLHY